MGTSSVVLMAAPELPMSDSLASGLLVAGSTLQTLSAKLAGQMLHLALICTLQCGVGGEAAGPRAPGVDLTSGLAGRQPEGTHQASHGRSDRRTRGALPMHARPKLTW